MFVCIINCSCDLYCRYEMCCIKRVEYRAKRNIFKCKYCLWICPLMIIIWSMLNSSPSRYNIWDTAIRVFLFPFYVALFLASHSFNITTDLSSVYWHTHAADSISVGILRPFVFLSWHNLGVSSWIARIAKHIHLDYSVTYSVRIYNLNSSKIVSKL